MLMILIPQHYNSDQGSGNTVSKRLKKVLRSTPQKQENRKRQPGPASSFRWCRGVTVSTQDSESCDPSSNLGGTWTFSLFLNCTCKNIFKENSSLSPIVTVILRIPNQLQCNAASYKPQMYFYWADLFQHAVKKPTRIQLSCFEFQVQSVQQRLCFYEVISVFRGKHVNRTIKPLHSS